jgi:hypothetical protein
MALVGVVMYGEQVQGWPIGQLQHHRGVIHRLDVQITLQVLVLTWRHNPI